LLVAVPALGGRSPELAGLLDAGACFKDSGEGLGGLEGWETLSAGASTAALIE